MSKRVLKNRDFRNLWIGQAVSQFGDALYYLVFLYFVQKLTGNASLVGLVGALQAIPYVLFSPWAGVLADRHDRRFIMVLSDVSSVVILLVLSVWLLIDPTPPVVVVMVTAFSLASVNVFFAPAKGAAIPRLVPAEQLIEANSLSATTQSLMPLLGLALSASVLGVIERLAPGAFFVTSALANAATFVVSAWYLSRLPKIIPDREHEEQHHPVTEFLEGYRVIVRDTVLKTTMVQAFLMNLLVSPFMVVYIAVNEQWFGGHYSGIAWIEVAFMVGLLLASIGVGMLKIIRPGIAFCYGLMVCGAFVALMAFSRNIWVFAVWNLICGLALPFAQIPMQTYAQLVVADAVRGRVSAVMTMIALGTMPFGAGIAGFLLQAWGPETMFILMGVGLVLSALSALLVAPFRDAKLPQAPAETPA